MLAITRLMVIRIGFMSISSFAVGSQRDSSHEAENPPPLHNGGGLSVPDCVAKSEWAGDRSRGTDPERSLGRCLEGPGGDPLNCCVVQGGVRPFPARR